MARPEDECPYRKPFAPDFADCPAFQARQFIPLDTMYQPLEPVLTCRHLETRALPQRHRWYAACSLGDAESRRRWAQQVGGERLERIRAIQAQLGAAIAPYSARLWELKGQQLRAIRDGHDAQPATQQLRELAGLMTADLRTFLTAHGQAFNDIEMPADAALRLINLAIDRFIDTQFATEVSLEVPDDILQRFPESVRTFFRPGVPEQPGTTR
jgi:hypothetical protein